MGQARGYHMTADEHDREAEQNAEAQVVNVSPWPARFKIDQQAGSPPRRFTLKPGQAVHLPAGYTHEFVGAGRQPVRATIESLTEREVYPRGPSLPQVVHVERAAQMRDRWEHALTQANLPPPPVDVFLPSANGGEPIKMTVQPAPLANAPQPVASVPIDDDEDQAGGPLDEPPPDHNEPLPEAKAKGKRS